MTLDDITELKQAMERVEAKVNENASKIAGMAAQRGIAEMLIKWIIFPLVSIMAAGFGIERVITG